MKQIFLLLICLFGSRIGMAQSERSGPETWGAFSDTARLQNSEVLLDEIHVSASRIQRKADRYVMQVSPDVNQDGMELLRQAPGVWISEGQVSINGSTGTKIYVNGREIRLEGELLTSYLQSLRSEDIRSIEVEPFAGAEQDAQSKGGAIHILSISDCVNPRIKVGGEMPPSIRMQPGDFSGINLTLAGTGIKGNGIPMVLLPGIRHRVRMEPWKRTGIIRFPTSNSGTKHRMTGRTITGHFGQDCFSGRILLIRSEENGNTCIIKPTRP